jgi:transcriptional regulator with XRE-family HTH domain
MLEESLSKGERLFVWRHRRRLTRGAAARFFGVTLGRYKRWEAGTTTGVPTVQLGGLEPQEHYVVLRKRSGYSLKDIAEKMGISTRKLRTMELGESPLDRQIDFWGG